MKENYKVYCHTFPNGKIYIGITKQELYQRFKGGKGYKGKTKIWYAIQKYGWENIKHKLLYDNLTKEEAEQKEIELISLYNSNNSNYGYNTASGGNCIGTVSEETKEKIRKANKGKSYHAGYWKGKKLSNEHRKKLSDSHKGQKNIISEKTKIKISNSLKGHEVSKETRLKISKKVICIDNNKIYSSLKEASEKTGISYKGISACCNGRNKSIYNTHWEFLKEENR